MLAHPGGDGKPALRRGVNITAQHAPPPFSPPRPDVAWDDRKPTRTAHFDPPRPAAVHTLGPGASLEVLRITLNDWFDLSKPGMYRVKITLDDEVGIGQGLSGEAFVPVAYDFGLDRL